LIDDAGGGLAAAYLRSEGFQILEAQDAGVGMQLAAFYQPDLILLNVGLAGQEWIVLLRRLKENPRTRGIPVIYMTALETADRMTAGLELGAVDFLVKPFEATELCARVQAALQTKGLHKLLEERAHIDGLTGLGNRLAFEERLCVEWVESQKTNRL